MKRRNEWKQSDSKESNEREAEAHYIWRIKRRSNAEGKMIVGSTNTEDKAKHKRKGQTQVKRNNGIISP